VAHPPIVALPLLDALHGTATGHRRYQCQHQHAFLETQHSIPQVVQEMFSLKMRFKSLWSNADDENAGV
jgi:hypothetical protein